VIIPATEEARSDPERLRMWQNEQDKLRTVWDLITRYHSISRRAAAGSVALRLRQVGRGSSRGGSCSERTHPPGATEWTPVDLGRCQTRSLPGSIRSPPPALSN